MSAQKQKFIVSTSASGEKLFPDSIATTEKSLIFMYRTVAVAFSSVAYLRNMFPGGAFTKRLWEGCEIPIINTNDPRSKTLMIYIQGMFDAMKRGYLREAVLGISQDADKPEEVVEAYTFRFLYESGRPSLTVSGMDDKKESGNLIPVESSKESVKRLLRQMSLFVTSLENLTSPSDAYFTIKLAYYDEKTPQDYEPPNFKPCETSDFEFVGAKKICAYQLGRVKTLYHCCRVGVRSTLSLKVGKSFDDHSSDITNKTPTRSRITRIFEDGNENKVQNSKKKKASIEDPRTKSIL